MKMADELLQALKGRREEILRAMAELDREAAAAREEAERKLADIRARRLPQEEHLRRLDALIEAEGGK
jgi:hypothetical protein